ncbi:MAG: trehalose-phosphatase [Chthoniobacter sp.]|nr:trehalose-phosphatase [Chthoniobacter sp.]
MTDERAEKLEGFFRALGAAKAQPLLLLDYDGTLAAFRVDRFRSRPWAGVRELLKSIQSQGKTRMAVITGRPACEIAPMLQLTPPLEVWGLHGAERLYPDGRRELESAPGESREKLDAVRAQLKIDALGGLYEDKDNAAVMHWRGYSVEKAQAIRARAMELFEPLAKLPGLRLLDFDGGVELRAGRDKGGAIETIMAEGATDAPVAYLGDDLSDEAAFGAVNRARGPHLSVLVRRKQRETAAEVWIKPPAELREFLERWWQALAVR